jgi:hypothetical protein
VSLEERNGNTSGTLQHFKKSHEKVLYSFRIYADGQLPLYILYFEHFSQELNNVMTWYIYHKILIEKTNHLINW